MHDLNPKAAKVLIKNGLKALRRQYAKTFHAFTSDDLLSALHTLGLSDADTVLVHSSFDAFVGFQGKPTDVIAVLQSAVGRNGAILMPTLPFTGTAVDYVRRSPQFDVLRTPSRMGLLSELFRRSSGVVRSVHPTHAVAIWGRDAESIACDHFKSITPCGRSSPFADLIERNGKILLLGADIDSLTFYHWIEEALEDRLPLEPFTREVYSLNSKQRDGTLVTTQTRLFEPAVSRRRNLHKLVPELKSAGAWRRRELGSLVMTLLSSRDVYAATIRMLDRGIVCYD